jgi:two-component system cell cycle sensor histidine kinase/response regulator CckA
MREDTEKTGPMTLWRGSGLILVIDDHALVCEVLRHLLEDRGFTVLTACDGSTGVAIFRQHTQEIRAVLLDLIMPGMSGLEVLQAIHGIQPEARVLVLTGVPEEEAKAQLGHAVAGYIQKSFQLDPFLATLRQVLGE